ncbi:hypothetical protein C8R47DRAFT_1004774 [Mycena vitilis]|nr:hypothetical protein C8R47DRAFT_1004774 [Mycena vitilis]
MEQPGLLEWCNATRFTMANDPGRLLFQEQIQTHGFLFLTDYLDNILAGPRRDPLIELVKTPGRKKATNKRPVATPSGLKHLVAVSLEDESETSSKENQAPVNNFHRALLQAKENSPPPSRAQDTSHSPEEHIRNTTQKATQVLPVVFAASPVRTPSPPAAVMSQVFVEEMPISEPQFLVATPADQNDLSMIAEDDEMERSRASLQSSHVNRPITPVPQVAQEAAQGSSLAEDETTLAPLPADPFQNGLSSPPQPTEPLHNVPSPTTSRRSPSPASPHMAPSETRFLAGSYTVPLPDIPSWHPREMYSDRTEPLPSQPAVEEVSSAETMNVVVQTTDAAVEAPRETYSDMVECHEAHSDMTESFASLPAVTEEDNSAEVAAKAPPTSPKGLAHKASVPSFPSLPAPLPFRKSIRVPSDPSAAHNNLGAATPGGALAGKRTSWLMRAREVKALEITVKKPIPAPSIVPGASSSNKRKSGDMFGGSGATGLEDEERKPKVAKTVEGDEAPTKPKTPDSPKLKPEQDVEEPSVQPHEEQEGLLVQLKRTVDGLGSRFGKSMGKSLGGAAAANALAEARAAAEARIAERHHKEEEATMALGAPAPAPPPSSTEVEPMPVFHSSHNRLSLSELVTSSENKGKGKEVDNVQVAASTTLPPAPEEVMHAQKDNGTSDASSPSPVFHVAPAPAPVFNKPPPVFVPPAPTSQAASTFKMPVTTAFSKPASMALGLAPRIPSPKQATAVPLSAQSTLDSIRSDGLFDSQDDVPAWMPSTQDTEYTSGFGSQSQCSPPEQHMDDDTDDSWPPEEKLRVGWFGANSKEDSMTWSTLPTESQRRDTGPALQDAMDASQTNDRAFQQTIPGSFHMDVDDAEYDDDEREAVFDQSVLGEMEIDPTKSTVTLVEPRSQSQMSQMSTASSASSQTHGGFLGQASKLMNSVLGTSKKGKPEVKSLQLAAVAAKKQQEEKEKKANRLKEMENRRQAALQRKADEEKSKAQDEERRLKEENDRRKKEREDNTDKRPLKGIGTKKEEENGKKRKIIGEMDKKPELKKPLLKPTFTASMSSKLPSKSILTKPQSALASSTTYNAASTSRTIETNTSKASVLQAKGKLVTKNMVPDDEISQPSQFLQTQMAARAKAQLQAANLAPPTVSSESIELPDVNSEYSDSDDEDRPRTFDPPSWAQSPDLRQALEVQSTINPDEVFGAIRPLKMDELFRNRTGRFRARTSSANWTGTDRLTVEEEHEYARRMGFR